MIQVTFSIPLMPLAVFAIYHESTTILIYLCSFLLHWTSKLANKQTILQTFIPQPFEASASSSGGKQTSIDRNFNRDYKITTIKSDTSKIGKVEFELRFSN